MNRHGAGRRVVGDGIAEIENGIDGYYICNDDRILAIDTIDTIDTRSTRGPVIAATTRQCQDQRKQSCQKGVIPKSRVCFHLSLLSE